MDILSLLVKIGSLLNIDAETILNRFVRDTAEREMRKVLPALKKRALKERFVPKELSDDAAEKRELIRYYLYYLCKGILPWGPMANILKRYLADGVLAAVVPQVTAAMKFPECIELVLTAALAALPQIDLPD